QPTRPLPKFRRRRERREIPSKATFRQSLWDENSLNNTAPNVTERTLEAQGKALHCCAKRYSRLRLALCSGSSRMELSAEACRSARSCRNNNAGSSSHLYTP